MRAWGRGIHASSRRLFPVHQGDISMSKARDAKKSEKKEPTKTLKEKREAKKVKKEARR